MNSRENIRLCLETLYEMITSLHEILAKLIKQVITLEAHRLRLFDSLEFLAYRFQLALFPYTRNAAPAPAVGNQKETHLYTEFSKALQHQEKGKMSYFSDALEAALCRPLTKIIVAVSNALEGTQGSSLRKNTVKENRDPLLQLTAIRMLMAENMRHAIEGFFAAIFSTVAHSISSWIRGPSLSSSPSLVSMEWSGSFTRKREAINTAAKQIQLWRSAFDEVVVQILRSLAKFEEVGPLIFNPGGQPNDPILIRIICVNKNMNRFFHAKFLNFHHDILAVSERLKECGSSLSLRFSSPTHGQHDFAALPVPSFCEVNELGSRDSARGSPKAGSPKESARLRHTASSNSQRSVTLASASQENSSPSVQSTAPASPMSSRGSSRRVRFSASGQLSQVGSQRSLNSLVSTDKLASQIQQHISEIDSSSIDILKKLLRSLEVE